MANKDTPRAAGKFMGLRGLAGRIFWHFYEKIATIFMQNRTEKMLKNATQLTGVNAEDHWAKVPFKIFF